MPAKPKREYKENKVKQVLKDAGHDAAKVDKEKWTSKDDGKKALKKLLRITDTQWQGVGMG